MLVEKIHTDMIAARKSGKKSELSILSVLLGEIQQIGGSVSDGEVIRVIKGLIKSNEETLDHLETGQDAFNRLSLENMVLVSYLPLVWVRTEIEQYLRKHLLGVIREQRADGQAIGIAVKLMNSNHLPINNQDVAAVVRQLRSEA